MIVVGLVDLVVTGTIRGGGGGESGGDVMVVTVLIAAVIMVVVVVMAVAVIAGVSSDVVGVVDTDVDIASSIITDSVSFTSLLVLILVGLSDSFISFNP